MIAFADSLGLAEIDLLGFSIGGFVAQEIALVRPALVRRLVLAATGPKGAPGMHGWRAADHRRRGRSWSSKSGGFYGLGSDRWRSWWSLRLSR
jgi:pimeloyl-ACP methyl ester carboxylesterase